jgi:hypothetical protein
MKTQLAALTLLFSTSLLAADYSKSKELYMPNESGGYVVLTLEECKFPNSKKQGFNSRAYATETDSETPVTHEGCWYSPDTSDAPKHPGIKIIPLVNLWFDGDTVTFPQSMFGPEKRRWDAIKPNV